MRPVDETGGWVGSRLPCWLTAAGFLRGEGIFYYPITLGEGCRAGSGERRAESRERGAESREQGAGSRGQGAGSREQGAESREQVNLSHSRPNGWFLPELARKNPPSDLHIPVGHSCLRCLSAALRHYHSNGWFSARTCPKKSPFRPSYSCRPFSCLRCLCAVLRHCHSNGWFLPELARKNPLPTFIFLSAIFLSTLFVRALRNNHANGWFLPELAQNKSSFRLSCSCRPFSCLRCLSAALRHYHSNGWFARTCSKRSSVPPSYSCRPFSCLRCLSGCSGITMPTGGFARTCPKQILLPTLMFLSAIFLSSLFVRALRNNHANGWFCPNLPKTNPPSDFNVPVGHFPVFAVCPARSGITMPTGGFARTCPKQILLPTFMFLSAIRLFPC